MKDTLWGWCSRCCHFDSFRMFLHQNMLKHAAYLQSFNKFWRFIFISVFCINLDIYNNINLCYTWKSFLIILKIVVNWFLMVIFVPQLRILSKRFLLFLYDVMSVVLVFFIYFFSSLQFTSWVCSPVDVTAAIGAGREPRWPLDLPGVVLLRWR